MAREQSVPPSQEKRARGRPKRFDGIISAVVAGIASGALPPGERVPVRRAMAVQYDATIVTVQKALAQLERSGIVRSDGRQGTFVSQRPPCLFRFGLLLPDQAAEGGAYPSLFDSSLAAAVAEHGKQAEGEWVVYEGLLAGGKGLKALRSDLARHHLAGLVFPLWRTMLPLLREVAASRIPIVQLGGYAAEPGCHLLEYDRQALAVLAARSLVEAGSRRPMVAVLATIDRNHLAKIRSVLKEHGVVPDPGSIMGFDHAHGEWIHEWMTGQWARPAGQRPDGLLVLDDNLHASMQASMKKLGIVPGRDLPVVTYCNLPYHRQPTGCIGIGCDSRVILRMARDRLRILRRGGVPPGELVPMTLATGDGVG